MAKRKKKASKTNSVTVSRSALNRVISLGASHHAVLAALKRTVKATPARKAKKKASKKKASKRRKSR